MAQATTRPSALPVGETSLLAYVEEQLRNAPKDLMSSIDTLELLRHAVNVEPSSSRLHIIYCEFFWTLYADSHAVGGSIPWTEEEQEQGRELCTLDAALQLWQDGYEATKYQLSGSHELWDKWIELELEQLARTRTSEGVRRITHLFRERLQMPHKTWDATSQMFSSFLSEYNTADWERAMKEITALAKKSKQIWDVREPFEQNLVVAASSTDQAQAMEAFTEYLAWAARQQVKNTAAQTLNVQLCLSLYDQALTGTFAQVAAIWSDYIVYISDLHTIYDNQSSKYPEMAQILPNSLNVLRRAVQRCPESGRLWARYILSAEESELGFNEIESIKHAATGGGELDKDDMSGILDMYAAWCGYLKRRAMSRNATDEDADVAHIGLVGAREDVQVWGRRKYGAEFQGDPNFRLERIFIQYLTEKRRAIEDSRSFWAEMAKKPIHADSYEFWLGWYLWEIALFIGERSVNERSPTPVSINTAKSLKVPSQATSVLARAIQRRTLDWPEKIMEIYLQHCNDYEIPETLRRASDAVYKGRKAVSQRREEAAAAQAAAYNEQRQEQQVETAAIQHADETPDTGAGKRKRDDNDYSEQVGDGNKKPKHDTNDATGAEQLKRDRENTSVYVSGLTSTITQTKIKQYFREYGHIRNLFHKTYDNSAVALIEFESPEDVQSALLRDGKYLGQDQLKVEVATGTTLYVTNYPPEGDEAYIRDLFKDCGEVFSVRLPSLKFNTHRRFCYVSFRTAEGATLATQLDGTLLDDKYRLSIKHSDPAQKKKREGAQEEGREVHVTNVDLKAVEDDIQVVFERYGSVERVRIPTNRSGQHRGTAFVVFKLQHEADAAVAALDKTKFMSKILNVEKSKAIAIKTTAKLGAADGASPSHTPARGTPRVADGDEQITNAGEGMDDDTNERARDATFALLGIPDTINDVRLRAFVEGYGQLDSLVLHPSHGGAILQFVDAATAGKAQLRLSGAELEGRKLSTGSVAELLKAKGEHNSSIGASQQQLSSSSALKMAPPSMVRRPAASGRKPRLGVTGTGVRGQEQDTVDTSSTGPKKSNADFRAMFLNKSGD